MGKVVKVNVYVTDMRNFEAMNEAYLGVFEDPQPVSSGPMTFCCCLFWKYASGADWS